MTLNSSYNDTGKGYWCPSRTYVDSDVSKGFKTAAYAIALLVSLTGNSLVIAVVSRTRRTRSTVTNHLIANLAVSDLLLTVSNMPQSLYFIVNAPDFTWASGTWGTFLCKFQTFSQCVSVGSSVLSLTVIAVDRFYAIVFPMKRKPTFFITKVAIVTVWLVAMATSAPFLYTMRTQEYEDGFFCREIWSPPFDANEAPKTFTVVLFIVLYVVPLTAMSVLYGILIWKLWIHKVPGNQSLARQRRDKNNKKKVLKMLITVVALFAFCWLPVYTTQFLFFFAHINVCIPTHLPFIGYFLGHLNSAINPCVYALFNANFRRGSLDVIRSARNKLQDTFKCLSDHQSQYERQTRRRTPNVVLKMHRPVMGWQD